MHYYPFNIGDYQSHTSHLCPIEDLAYRRMLDWCYLNESPLPEEVGQIARLVRMREHCECIAAVLQEFFIKTDGGWTQKRIEKEVHRYRNRSENNARAAKIRWENEQKQAVNASAMQTHSNRNAKQETITINQEPDMGAQTLKRFVPPTVEQVYEYMQSKGFGRESEAVKFVNYWESVGWMRGRSKMKCWKATARTWMQTYWERANGQRA